MDFFTTTDNNYIEKPKTEIVYIHDSEGMTNDRSSCWMISVIQALRGSQSFRKVYAPKDNENNHLKKELFHLFDISEGKNGEMRRPVRPKEIREFKRLVIGQGLPAKMNGGFLEAPFLYFLLKKIHAKPVEYLYTKALKKKRQTLLSIPLNTKTELRKLQMLVTERNITFKDKNSIPQFLPVYLDRPVERHYYSKHDHPKEFSRTPIAMPSSLYIPVLHSKKRARFSLCPIVIGRDSKNHAYSYVIEKDGNGNKQWVEYNDAKVIIHKDPKDASRRKTSNLTPFEDACKHAEILIYQFSGYV